MLLLERLEQARQSGRWYLQRRLLDDRWRGCRRRRGRERAQQQRHEIRLQVPVQPRQQLLLLRASLLLMLRLHALCAPHKHMVL